MKISSLSGAELRRINALRADLRTTAGKILSLPSAVQGSGQEI
jgi:hypothetical protein